MNKKLGTSKALADKLVKTMRRKTRQSYSSEEKIRIVLAGLRGEETIFGAMPPRGYLRKPVLQLVKGISRSRETPSVWRYVSASDIA